MENNIKEYYFKNDKEWRAWLETNHASSLGIYLIFYKIETNIPSMRWEEAVKVALCYGWIDSTVKKFRRWKKKTIFLSEKRKKCLECFE